MERLDGLLGLKPVAIGALILVEVVQGFRPDKYVATARQLFRSLAPLPMHDGIIATACIEANLPLLFSGRDFLPYVEQLGHDGSHLRSPRPGSRSLQLL